MDHQKWTVSVRVTGARAELRLAGLGPGCTVGEMGLLERRPHSADVYADDDVEADMLTLSAFESIMREHHRLGLAIVTEIARQLSRRLRDTSEELRVCDN
jgi:sulfate permease, SulP family